MAINRYGDEISYYYNNECKEYYEYAVNKLLRFGLIAVGVAPFEH